MIKIYYRKPDGSLGKFVDESPDNEVGDVRMAVIELLMETEPKPVAVLALLQGGK